MAVLLLGAAPAHALDLAFAEVSTDSTGLVAVLELPGLYSPDLDDRLQRGLPFTLIFELELMRQRRNWFDAQVDRYTYLLKVDYDPWSRLYSFQSPEEETEERDTTAVRRLIESQSLSFPLEDPLDPSRIYYLNARATLKLLTADDIREVEEWLGGHMKRRSIIDLPGGFLGILKDASGLGDESETARSRDFRLRGGGVVLVEDD